MNHDILCPQSQMYQDNAVPWWGCECQQDFDCRCELIAKVRDDERRWVLKKTSVQLRSHVVKNGVCACGGAVDDQSEHWLDIVDYYMMTLLPQHEVIDWF